MKSSLAPTLGLPLMSLLLAMVAGHSALAQQSTLDAAAAQVVRTYFEAVERESLPMIEQCYYFRNDDTRKKLLTQFQSAFDMADTRIESLKVNEVKLYPAEQAGLVLVDIAGALTQARTGDVQTKKHAYAIVLRLDGNRWKIAKVMRRADYDNAVRIAALNHAGPHGGMLDTEDPPRTDDPSDTASDPVVRLTPVADNYVYAFSYRGWNATNWGGHVLASAGWHPLGGESRAYFRFDLPQRKDIQKAVLRLRLCHLAGSGALDLGIHRVQTAWSEGVGTYPPAPTSSTRPGDQTWNNQPAFAEKPAVVFRPPKEIESWVEIDITPLVRAWLDGQPNHGFVIKAQGRLDRSVPECVYGFRTREFNEPDLRPVLVLETSAHDGGSVADGDSVQNGHHSDTDDDQGGSMTDDGKTDTSKETTVRQAYQQYIDAYNRLTSLMAAGKGDTAEAQQAYADYQQAKKKYEALIQPPLKSD